MKSDPVLIVGAGPVGLLTALGLAQRGVEVAIIEAERAISDSPRAVVYHWSVLDGINRLGLLEDAKKIGFTKQDYCYLVFKTREIITWTLSPLDDFTPFPYNLHLGQNRLAEIALARLRLMSNATVHWNTRFAALSQDADGVTVQAAGVAGAREFRAGWVIAADGARSAVRQAVGLNFDGNTWPERFVATNIRYDFEKFGYARSTLMIDDVYGAVIVKIDETGLWRCTYCEDVVLPESEVLRRMPAHFNVILPGTMDYELVQHSPYRSHQRVSERFRTGRVLLAGDAAHVTNPTGGLGLTCGLFDSFALCEVLPAVIRGEVGHEVLERYSDERRRRFVEFASPQATEIRRLIYHSDDPRRLEADLKQLRRLSTDKDFLIKRLLFTKKLETPSLLENTHTIA